MKTGEYLDEIRALGLKPADVAALCGVSVRAAFRYSAGTRRVPPPLVSYLRLYKAATPAQRAVEHKRAGIEERTTP